MNRAGNLLLVFCAEAKRHFRDQWSHLGDSLSWLVYTLLMFAAVVVILNGISGGDLGTDERFLVMIGWLTWMVAGSYMRDLPAAITDEAETGTLEQLCLSPVPLSIVLTVRGMVHFIGVSVRGLLAAAILTIFITPLPIGSSLIMLFFISMAGAYGMGFLFAGLALVFKRIAAFTELVYSLMIFLTGAFVGLESLGWVFTVLRYMFPLTWGISMMRQVVGEGLTLTSLLQSGELVGLILHSAVFVGVGLTIFAWGYRHARMKGTLAHY